VLLVIELNQEFVQYLRATIRDPRLRIVHGSAADVRRILAEHDLARADYIISSIPYSLIPTPQRQRIVTGVPSRAEGRRGRCWSFQYNRALLPCLKSSFSSVKLKFSTVEYPACIDFFTVPRNVAGLQMAGLRMQM